MATTRDLEVQFTKHEAVCAELYNTFLARVDRLEKLLIKAAGTLIIGMAGVIIAVVTKGV